jgi:hypothetical protein
MVSKRRTTRTKTKAKRIPTSKTTAAGRKTSRKKSPRKAEPARSVATAARQRTRKKKARSKKSFREPGPDVMRVAVPEELVSPTGRQSGDLQGISNVEDADSESVDELLEEGNAFEAGVVAGVEEAGDAEEVRTREVPVDDVPGEYLEED